MKEGNANYDKVWQADEKVDGWEQFRAFSGKSKHENDGRMTSMHETKRKVKVSSIFTQEYPHEFPRILWSVLAAFLRCRMHF